MKKPLYICRYVINTNDIYEWAKTQGIAHRINYDDLHITQCYSHAPVDWDSMRKEIQPETLYLPEYITARSIEVFGEEAVVLKIFSPSMQERHDELMSLGCSHDYPDYSPHMTVFYNEDGEGVFPVNVYSGPIILGEEVFAVPKP